jgi:hypothetical protein
MATAGAGLALAQRLPSSSPAVTRSLLELLELLDQVAAEPPEQQVMDEVAASPGCLAHLAQLATDPSQDPETQRMALTVLAGPLLAANRCAVAAAVAPHAAALVQRLSPRPGATAWKLGTAWKVMTEGL